jgi:hypothetical protein
MRTLTQLATRLYGDRIFHLLILSAALALGAYTVAVLGVDNLFNPTVWWQSIGVWFALAVIGHDLILFPLYALADRLLPTSRRPPTHRSGAAEKLSRRIPLTNYVRIPTMAAALLLLMFYPGIIKQGAPTYHAATGLTQDPFLTRWLLITAALYLTSALWYSMKTAVRHRHSKETASAPLPTTVNPPSAAEDHQADHANSGRPGPGSPTGHP